jgi:hypothetical protein
MKLEFFVADFRKILISNFIKIHPVGPGVFYADGQSDKHGEANILFSEVYELT